VVNESTTLAIVAEACTAGGLRGLERGPEAGSQVTAGDVKLPQGSELAVDPDFVLRSSRRRRTAEQLEGAEAAEPEAVEETEAPACGVTPRSNQERNTSRQLIRESARAGRFP